MAINQASLRAWVTRHILQTEAIAVSVLAIVVFGGLGIRARRAAAPARADIARLGAAAAEIDRFRSAFVASPPEHELRLADLADSLGIAVPREDRVALAQRIAASAEALGLSDVRVRFAPPDSAAQPARPELVGATAIVADYSLSVEFAGGFDAVLSLLDRLPASVALQRLVAGTASGQTRYRLALAVFESQDRASPTPGGSH